MTEFLPKRVRDSAIDYYPYEIFPDDLNALGIVFGGRVVEMADRIAGIVAQRHSGKSSVTLLIDSVRFLAPAKQGEVLVYKAAANRAWKTSMEVGIKVYAENYKTGESRHVLSAYFTFVALDENGRPTEIPPVLSETSSERRRFEEAERRREHRFMVGGRNK